MVPVFLILFIEYSGEQASTMIVYMNVFVLCHVSLQLFDLDLLFFFFWDLSEGKRLI